MHGRCQPPTTGTIAQAQVVAAQQVEATPQPPPGSCPPRQALHRINIQQNQRCPIATPCLVLRTAKRYNRYK
jgi:hypothetical protein